ncbi:MAG TPA: MFS transporter [Candidatus Binatia bacterium]|nr:MFS transporter [Candidatus Binatia bacterium]
MTLRSEPARIQPTPVRWRILVLLMALCFISHFNRASMASAGDERIMKQFGISTEQMGVVYSAFLVVYTVFMIPGGFFIDRFGPRVALAGMGLGTALFCAFTGMVGWGFIAASQVWLSLLIVRSLMGLLTTPLHPASARAAANWFPQQQRALANGLITGAALLAYAAVHPLFGALIDRFDWPIAFLISGGGTAALALVWFASSSDGPRLQSEVRLSRPRPSPAATHSISVHGSEAFGRLLRDRNLLLLTLSYAAVGYFQYLFFYWMHYYFDDVVHMGKTESRFYSGMPNLAMAVCMPLGGWLTDKAQKQLGQTIGRTVVPRIGMTASAVLLLFGIFATQPLWIVLWFTLSLGILGLCEGAFWTTAVELGGTRGGTAAAIMNTGGNGIGLLAPMVTPWVGAKLGWVWGIGLGAFVALAGASCWFWIEPRQRAQNDRL